MNHLIPWAAKWGVSLAALDDLQRQLLGQIDLPLIPNAPVLPDYSEAGVTSRMRLEAAQKGVLLFRNNVGALLDKDGRPVRFGLANDSAQMNQHIKSGDWIGLQPMLITPDHVGHTLGLFVSAEVKRSDWKYTGKGREVAQKRWIDLIVSRGGKAMFVTREGAF